MNKKSWLSLIILGSLSGFFVLSDFSGSSVSYYQGGQTEREIEEREEKKEEKVERPPLDEAEYDRRLEIMANNPPPKDVSQYPQTIPPTLPVIVSNPWPVGTAYPKSGAILPFERIVAYYGNLYSTKMGVLGQYGEAEMLARLLREAKKWEAADPETPVRPALHYIAVVAQNAPGKDEKYRTRMPESEVEKVLKLAEKINALVFLDFQVAFSTLEKELPVYEKYLKLPNVHLGIDPEFSMKGGIRPGKVIGTFDASDVNLAVNYLAGLVEEYDLPPKVLVVHRFTGKMVTNYKEIKPSPEVQIVMHMDGWGEKAKKISTYKQFIVREPVQFAGFKLFYKNDILKPGSELFTPEELLKLNPRPIYIQYQ